MNKRSHYELPNWLSWLKDASGWLLPILLIAFWDIAARYGWITSKILPAPSDIVNAAINLSLSAIPSPIGMSDF